RRIPKEVVAALGITGKDPKRKQIFPQSVDHETANRLSGPIVDGWEAEWDRVRPQPKRIPWFDPAAIMAQQQKLAAASAKVLAMVEAGDVILPTADEYRQIRLQE